jgi:glycosyltransferase involved in cell wall biosynthesis
MTNGLMPRQDGTPLRKARRVAGALRIGVNLVALVSNGGGMRQYVLQLLPWMLRQSAHHFVLFYHWRSQPTITTMLRRLTRAERNRVRTVFIIDQVEIFGYAADFDVYFCPLNCLAPDLLDRPTLTMLPDIQEHFFPHYFTDEQLSLRSYYYPRGAHAVTTLLTISRFSRQTICDVFGLPPERVRVIHLASSDEVRDAQPEWPAMLGELPERFVLYPANLYPHKNHKVLLDAIGQLDARGIDCACVMTGQPAQPGIDIDEEIRVRGLQGKAIWLGHVAAGALRYLYEHAAALCFPSEFEGFGMPLVEAMECGCPVIASRAASIPEVAGGAALLIDSTPEAFADAIARLLQEPQTRHDLIARGQARARRFHPRRVARKTLQAIAEAVSRFWQSRSSAAQSETISYVVRPISGGETLIRTLASLAFEVREHDEILILAHKDTLTPDVQILCENLDVVRFLPRDRRPGAWLDEVGNDYLYYLQEGDWICEGSTRTALKVFAEDADCQAVLGEVLVRDAEDKLAKVRYLPPRPRISDAADASAARVEVRREEKNPPASAAFWRTKHLRRCRHLLGEASWAVKVLEQAGPHMRVCYRSFASTVEPRVIVRLRIRTAVRRGVRWLRVLPQRVRRRLGQWLGLSSKGK